MNTHDDLSQPVVLHTDALAWTPSPILGVERRPLDRLGGEVARATSIVRYAPGSRFAPHSHAGGEEILVLEGTFQDEQGAYPAGTYLRNPAGSSHAPFSDGGCTLLVKLRQMHPADQRRVVIDTHRQPWRPGLAVGLEVMPLHVYGSERVALTRWAPGTLFETHGHPGGEEILVLEGTFQDERGTYPAGTWLRHPPGSEHRPWSEAGCTVWVKTGHLPATLPPTVLAEEGSPARVRPCEQADWPAVWALLEPVFRAGETFPHDPRISEAKAKTLWLDQSQAVHLAEAEGAIVGTYYLKPNSLTLGAHVANAGYVVAEHWRRRGIGTLLCQHSLREALRMGYRAMQFNLVVSENKAGLACWLANGFEIVGTLPGAFQHQRLGEVDAHVLFKRLGERL